MNLTDPYTEAREVEIGAFRPLWRPHARAFGSFLQAGTFKAILKPNSRLRSGVTYTVAVTTGAQDAAGNPLDQNPDAPENQPKIWKFKVR